MVRDLEGRGRGVYTSYWSDGTHIVAEVTTMALGALPKALTP